MLTCFLPAGLNPKFNKKSKSESIQAPVPKTSLKIAWGPPAAETVD